MSTKGDASEPMDRGRKLGDGATQTATDPEKVRSQLGRDRKRYAAFRAMAEDAGASPSERESARGHMTRLVAKHGDAVAHAPAATARRAHAEGPSHAAAPAANPWRYVAPEPVYVPTGQGPAGDGWQYAPRPASEPVVAVVTLDTAGGGFSPEARRHMRAGR